MANVLNAAQTAEFNDKGFTYARGLFAPDEVKLLTEAMEQDPAVRGSILDRRDGHSYREADIEPAALFANLAVKALDVVPESFTSLGMTGGVT